MAEEKFGTDSSHDEIETKIDLLERDLAKVSKFEDKKVLWGIPILLSWVILVKIISAYSEVFALVIAAGIPIFVFGGLAYVIYENIRKKRSILIERGFKCQSCGYLPRTINASGVYYSKECIKCKAKLNI